MLAPIYCVLAPIYTDCTCLRLARPLPAIPFISFTEWVIDCTNLADDHIPDVMDIIRRTLDALIEEAEDERDYEIELALKVPARGLVRHAQLLDRLESGVRNMMLDILLEKKLVDYLETAKAIHGPDAPEVADLHIIWGKLVPLVKFDFVISEDIEKCSGYWRS